MARVSDALTRAPERLTQRGIQDRVAGKDVDVRRAIAVLVDEGYVLLEPGPRGAHLHRLVKPFPGD